MGIDHGLNAPIECLNVLVKGTAVGADVLGDEGNARQQILDGDEQDQAAQHDFGAGAAYSCN